MKSHRAVFLAAVVFGLLSGNSQAGLIYSGIQNIPIPTTFDGVYLDIDTGANAASAMTGWDINPFFGGAGIANSPAFQPIRLGTGSVDPYSAIPFGTNIDGSLTYSSGYGGSGDPVPHFRNGAGQFSIGQPEYLGFEFTPNGGGGPLYGWMQVVLTNNVSGGMIVDWAYDDSGGAIAAGIAAVPEPGGACVGAALVGLALLQRRRRAC